MNARDSNLGVARAMWPACVTTLAVLAGAGVLLSAGYTFAAEPSASAEAKAAKKKKKGKAKDRPCANKNKRWILCKPRAGLYLGTVTQATPSGSVSTPLQFEVSAKRNSREVEGVTFFVRQWTGDTPSDTYYVLMWAPGPPCCPQLGQWKPVPSYECPTCDPAVAGFAGYSNPVFVQKTHGGFYGSDKLGNSRSYWSFVGDFLSKTRAKGKIWARGQADGFSIRTVTWKASWARKSPEFVCPFPENPQLCP